jgi:phage gp46-like protein
MIKLIRVAGGGFDVALDDPADPAGAAQTVVYAALLTDARAPVGREADGFAARGWWARPTAGTGLWHVRRQGLDDAARLETVRMVQQALDREPTLTNVQVADATQPGTVSEVQLAISGKHNGRAFLVDVTL